METIERGMAAQQREQKDRSLCDLLAAPGELDRHFVEISLGKDLTFVEQGLSYNGVILRAGDEARHRLCARVDAPWSYLKKLDAHLQAALLNEHGKIGRRKGKRGILSGFGTNPVAVVDREDLVTIIPGELVNLPNSDVIRAAAESMGTEGESLYVTRISNDVERFEVELASHAKETSVRVGDIVQAGISIIHCRYGEQATQIVPHVYRCVCGNGMLRRECPSHDNLSRTRRIPVKFGNGRELQMAQVRQLTQHAWRAVEGQVNEFKKTSERKANVEAVLRRYLLQARISWNSIGERLLAAWRQEGGEDTVYGAVNALTRVATHGQLNDRRRHVLASLAGRLAFSEVHVCPRCFSVLGQTHE